MVEAGDAVDTGFDAEEEAELTVVDKERSCLDCKKRNVCTVFQTAGGVLHPESWEGTDEPPIHLPDLAVICDEFEPREESENG
jgi:hypothetical protein